MWLCWEQKPSTHTGPLRLRHCGGVFYEAGLLSYLNNCTE
uniref:Uncharacterized protein n=1 Tax=Anguilla anguilla TaxID=7936 RepID=A0A0E9QHK5_ANGAN